MSKQAGYIGTILNRKTQALTPVRSFASPRATVVSKPVSVEAVRPKPEIRTTPAQNVVPSVMAEKAVRAAPGLPPSHPPQDAVRREPAPPPMRVETVKREIVRTVVESAKPRDRISAAEKAVESPVQPLAREPEAAPASEKPAAIPEMMFETAYEPQPFVTRVENVSPPRIETTIAWPSQLDAPQRSAVRIEVERRVRERIPADSRAKSAPAQKIEVRVDQVNVRLDAPPAPRAAAPRAAEQSAFGNFFRSRSLR